MQIVGSPQRFSLDAVHSQSCCVGVLCLYLKGTGPCGRCFSISADFSGRHFEGQNLAVLHVKKNLP